MLVEGRAPSPVPAARLARSSWGTGDELVPFCLDWTKRDVSGTAAMKIPILVLTTLTLLVTALTLVACSTAKITDKPSESSAAKSLPTTKPATEKPPSQPPTTPRSIVKEMFPNPPERTQSVECFRSFTPEMSIYMVVQMCGRPDEEVGSGIYIFVYHLRDGSTVAVGTAYLNRIDYVIYTDKSGKSSPLLQKRRLLPGEPPLQRPQ